MLLKCYNSYFNNTYQALQKYQKHRTSLMLLKKIHPFISSLSQAIDPEALTQTDGLDLDLAQQMMDMSLHEAALQEPSLKKVHAIFETEAESSKVNKGINLAFDLDEPKMG